MPATRKNAIVEAETRLRQAMLGSDVPCLDQLISADIVFTNHLGQVLSKQADLSAHSAGLLRFAKLEPSEQVVVLRDHFAVVSVKMHTEGVYANEAFSATIRYTRVWASVSGDGWQVVAGHSSLVQDG